MREFLIAFNIIAALINLVAYRGRPNGASLFCFCLSVFCALFLIFGL
jgi:hypothetical protein